MNIQSIKTATDYEIALARIMELTDARAGSGEGDELDVLGTFAEAYEPNIFQLQTLTPLR